MIALDARERAAIRQEMNKFENVLQSLRARRGWTQKEAVAALKQVADELILKEVRHRKYVGWENSESIPPSANDLKMIVSGFGLTEEEEKLLYWAAARVPPEINNLPHRNNFFTGREVYLERLEQFLNEGESVAITQPVSISGLGGIGKTQLAVEYAHRHHPEPYRTVFWANAADEVTLQASYDGLAQKLGLLEQAEREPEKRVEAVKRWLQEHTHWLLIMDNADDLELARSFMPATHQGRILLTTRSQIVDTPIDRQIELVEMTPEEGQHFLLKRSEVHQSDADTQEAAQQLVELLGRHPLALDQAGAYIKGNPVRTFAEYIDFYYRERRRLLGKRRAGDHPESVVVTFKLSIEKARELHPLAEDIARFCVFLQPDAIPEELFRHDESFKDTIAFDEGVEALRSYSLIKPNVQEKTYSMHRLVQAVMIDGMIPDLQKHWKARILRAMCSMIPAVRYGDRYSEKVLFLLRPHVLICTMWEEDEPAFMFDVSAVCIAMVVCFSTPVPPEMEPFLNRALEIRERYLGAEHPDTLLSLHHLAFFHWMQGNYAQAEHFYERVLPLYERWWGLEYTYTLICLEGLVYCYYRQGKYEQAVSVRQRVLADREHRFGPEHKEVAHALDSLAILYAAIPGKLGESESCYLRANAIWEKLLDTYPTDHLYQRVSQALREQRSSALTRAMQDEIREEAWDRLLGTFLWAPWPKLTFPDTQETRNGYAKFLRSREQQARAETLEMCDIPPISEEIFLPNDTA